MAKPWELRNQRTGEIVVSRLMVADGFLSRFVGLQFRKRLPEDTGLLLVPCGSVHTFCMRFPVDVIFLSATGKVLEVRAGLRPWRVAMCKSRAHAVLEVASGQAACRTSDQLLISSVEGNPELPASLVFLGQRDNPMAGGS